MFIGHFGAGLAAAKLKGAPSAPVLIIGSQLTDVGFFALALFGIERFRLDEGVTELNPFDLYHMPYTHSLVGTAGWALAFGLLVLLFTRRLSATAIAAAVVASHWLLDWLTHQPDLSLAGGPPYFGLGLWNVPALEIPLELFVFLGGAWLYARAVPTISPAGRWSLLAVTALLVAVQLLNWFGAPTTTAPGLIALQALAAFIVTALAFWIVDRLRKRRPS